MRTPVKSNKRRNWTDNRRSALFLAPSWIVLLIFFLSPMLMTLIFAFSDLSLTGATSREMNFIGFDNFVRMASDAQLYESSLRTLIFVVASAIIGQSVLGFLIAFLMKEKSAAFRRFMGTTVVTAWVIPEIVVAFTWVAFLGESGTLNTFLSAIPGFQAIEWLFDYPMVAVVVANIWRGTAFSMMAFQAALDDVPIEVEEAAVIDGAGRMQRIFHVVIPMVKGTIATNWMLVTLQALGVFALIYTMTGGGPGNVTTTLPIYMYRQAFVSQQLGYGTAISLVMLVIGAVFGILYTKFLKVKL